MLNRRFCPALRELRGLEVWIGEWTRVVLFHPIERRFQTAGAEVPQQFVFGDFLTRSYHPLVRKYREVLLELLTRLHAPRRE